MEENKVKENLLKKHWKIITINGIYIVIIIALVIALVYTNTPKTEADKVWKEKNNYEKDLTLDTYSRFVYIVYDEDKQKEKLHELEGKVQMAEKDRDALLDEIRTLEEDKAKLDGDIAKKNGEIVSMQAGEHTAGSDFDEGRYIIGNGDGHFAVRNSAGVVQVSTILGSRGVETYTYEFKSGDKVKASSPFTLTPVE